MTATPSPQTAQARRNQQFENRPASANAQCPLKALEVAIFPVRYAVDESPTKGSRQGPNPLPDGFSASHLPTLKTRSYTLRQVRDGWLYVWDEIEKTLHEYSIKGHLFTRLVWTSKDINSDIRNTRGDTKPYLLYPRDSRLQIAYSPVQWTWRICELMRSNPSQQAQWMRSLDLAGYCASYTAPHGADLRRLADCVADISPSGQVPSFNTTLIPTQEQPKDPDDQSDPDATKDPAMHFKPGISDALVLGTVPDQDTALFIALDDPLAVINDLNMNLTGRLAEIELFEEEYRNRLHSALAVQQSCGVELDAVMPKGLDAEQRLAFTSDAHAFLTSYGERHGSDMGSSLALIERHAGNESVMANKWRVSSHHPAWKVMAEDWKTKSTWRDDVRFEEVSRFLQERAEELRGLRTHVLHSEKDITDWLSTLKANAECVFFDTCDAEQTTELLQWAEGLAQCLGACGNTAADTAAQDGSVMRLAKVDFQGQEWLYRQYVDQNSLLGLALFNFNKELADALALITYNFITTGTIDGLGQQPDTSGRINTGSDFWQSVLGGAGDTGALLSLPAVQNSAIYKSLSRTAQQSLDALRNAVASRAQSAWNNFSAVLLPVLGGNRLTAVGVLTFISTQVLVTSEIADVLILQRNENYQQENRKWTMDRQIINKRLRGQQASITRHGNRYGKRSARSDVAMLEGKLAQIDADKPVPMRVLTQGQIHIQTIEYQQTAISALLATGGQSELQAQLHLKATNAVAYAARTKAWMDLNLGGALPVLLTALGIWNLMVTAKAIHHDGYLTSEEKNRLLAATATTGYLLAAMFVMPMWSKAGQMIGVIDGDTFKLTQAGAKVWLRDGKLAHAKLAQRLVVRTVGMAALNVLSSASEIAEINRQLDGTTSDQQSKALQLQRNALRVLVIAGGLQLAGSLSGLLFNFAWVMGPWMIGLLAIAGIVYLIASVRASYYHREGLRLWLYKSYWGKEPAIGDNDTAHGKSLWQLTQICLTPAISVRSTDNPYWHQLDGFWLEVTLPSQLAGQRCEIKAVPVSSAKGALAPRREILLKGQAYDELLHGYWTRLGDPQPLSQMPPTNDNVPGDVSYADADNYFVWRTWVPVSGAHTIEVEITYPGLVNEYDKEPMRYMFRARALAAPRTAELISNPMSDAPIEGELLSRSSVKPLSLALPKFSTES